MAGFRHELSEAQWRLVAPVLPPNGKRGGQWRSHRELLDAMFWKLNTGSGWRDLPERYGPWQSVYDRFRRWERDGTFTRILSALRLQLDVQHPCRTRRCRREKGGPETELGRSHGGWGSKIHLLTDGCGLPLEVLVSAGQRHESCFFEPLLEGLLAQGRSPTHLLGDKGYSAPRIRHWLRERAITPVSPHRADEHKLHPELPPVDFPRYRKRNVVERTIGFLKHSRSVATRFDKLPKCFLAIIKLAFIKIYLRKIDSSDTT